MKLVLATTLLVGLGVSGPALANAKLAEQKQCFQCHAVNKESIGPSFKKIKTLYKGTKGAEAKLIAIMRQGSEGNMGPHWGTVRMPDDSERPEISDREAKQLAQWILK